MLQQNNVSFCFRIPDLSDDSLEVPERLLGMTGPLIECYYYSLIG